MPNTYLFGFLRSDNSLTRSIFPHVLLLAIALFCINDVAVAADKKKDPPVAVPGACPLNRPTQRFTVDVTGNASSTGRTYEGPLCVEVTFNPAVQFTQIEAVAAASVKGPDPSSIFLGSSGSGAETVKKKVDIDVSRKAAPDAAAKTLPEIVAEIERQAQIIGGLLNTMKSSYSIALREESSAVDKLTASNKALKTTNADSLETSLLNQYLALKPELSKALAAPARFNPTDTPSKDGDVYLDEIQQLESRLSHLPLEFITGTKKPTTPQECNNSMDANWTDWYAVCKDSYFAPVKQELDADLAVAQLYTSMSEAAIALKKQAAIVQYWNTIFVGIGLSTTTDSKAASLTGLHTHLEIPCTGLFNNSVSTALSLVTLDYTPTLTGGDPTQKVQSVFVTVNCSTRFTISAGVGFSTIEQKTFAIIPGSDGKGGTVNIFGTTSDSRVTPVALAVTHVRLDEWLNHGVGLYGSLGVGGNLQTNASATYFLPGMSFAFWRTMYLTVGAGIGSQSILTGGYKVGDTVPAGVTTIGAVTGSSHTAGIAFAVTFTKP